MRGTSFTLDLRHAIHILTRCLIRSNADAYIAVDDGLVKARVETHFCKIITANADMLEINELGRFLFIFRSGFGLSGFCLVAPVNLALSIGIDVRVFVRRRLS